MLSDTKNVTRHESKKLEKKVFLWQFFRKNEKKYQNYPLLPYLKIELFLTSCKKHRYPATTGYPDPAIHLPDYSVSGRKSISGPTLVFSSSKLINPVTFVANHRLISDQIELKKKTEINTFRMYVKKYWIVANYY